MKQIIISLLIIFSLTVDAEVKLQRSGNTAHIVVNGKPMLILGGELSNSAATSIADIDSVIPRMAQMGLNTVLVPAQWDLIEANKGNFDFTLIDETIMQARKNNLKIIFLWFGAWKNSMSCYAPLWFKQNTKDYPRAITRAGKPLEIASAFSENVFKADNNAFTNLIKHIADIDRHENTVIMIQVENEIGMLEDARDYSPLAEKAYKQQVPNDLINALKLKQKGSWSQIFGKDKYADEKFMAYHYARYVERLAHNARNIYHIPLYVNAAMNSRGRKPGEYPSAGPLAHLAKIWRCTAPDIDILAPDIYDAGFKGWASQYAVPGNPLFIPESRCCINSGVRALYTFGEHQAVGFSAFAIDQVPASDIIHLSQSYTLINQLTPLLLKYQGYENTYGLLFDQQDRERIITDRNLVITCRHYFTLPWDSRATDGSIWPEGGAIIIKIAPDDYLIAGNGVVVTFQTTTEKLQEGNKSLGEDGFINTGGTNNTDEMNNFTGQRIGIGYIDEVTINKNGELKYLRRENGDQDHQGRHARISVGEFKILHVKLYHFSGYNNENNSAAPTKLGR